MSLKDKLNEVKSEEAPVYQTQPLPNSNELEKLMKETNELNTLMKSYIRVHMDKDGTSQMTLDNELSKITKVSQDVQEQMISILKALESTQRDYGNQLLQHLETGTSEMAANNETTVQKMGEIEGMLSNGMSQMNRRMNENMKDLEKKSATLAQSVRKSALLSYWSDVAKYGLGTAVFIVPVYLVIKFLFSLMGVEMP